MGRQGKGGEEVHHSAIGTGAAVQAWDRSWEDKVVGHKERGIEQAEALGQGNRVPVGGRKYRRHHTGKRGSTCKG